MDGGMPGVGKWLRPPRSILIFFVLVVCVPAATLIAFGIRLLDQDRALAHQRRLELLDHAADQGVHVLEQDLAARAKRLLGAPCTLDELPYDAVCVVLYSDRIDAVPSQRIPYYPVAQALKEMPSDPFQELESNEFREPVHLDKALEMSRALAASSDPAVRAGALLREARILRKLGQTREALAALGDLSTIASISTANRPIFSLAGPAAPFSKTTPGSMISGRRRLRSPRTCAAANGTSTGTLFFMLMKSSMDGSVHSTKPIATETTDWPMRCAGFMKNGALDRAAHPRPASSS